ncbi:sulfotransferase domain-containing protein [Allorhizobium ampelinum]|uniref:sulfotransferase domain-containing protein n=1 Tax=Allorhizobium ampelinum TaxID=3025782 RepID=UPI001F3DB646
MNVHSTPLASTTEQVSSDEHRIEQFGDENSSLSDDRENDAVELVSPIKNKQNIIWIASYPKSGNTWVRVFVHNLLRELRGETQGSQDINDLGRYAIWEHSYPHYTQILGKAPTRATAEEMAKARPAAQALISRQQQGLSLTKTHLCFGTDHGAPTINLDVTLAAIYIVRNPLDVAISYAHHCSRPIDAIISDMAQPGFRTLPTEKHVGELLGSWSQNVASWIGVASRPVHIIRYEDMLANPHRVFGGLAAFLGLHPTEKQLRDAVEKSSFAELAKQETEQGFKEKPQRSERFFREGRAGQWREVLSTAQVRKVLVDHEPIMQRMNYLAPNAGIQSKRR